MRESADLMLVEAQPEPFRVDPAAAVIVVDMQTDFASHGGMFDGAGVPIVDIQAIVEPVRRVLASARGAGIQVVFLKMEFEPDLADAGGPDTPNRIKHAPLGIGDSVDAPDGEPSGILAAGTWNTEIIPDLSPEQGDLIVSKHRYSGFYETPLDDLLRAAGIDTLIFVGATTSVCVESTLRDAFYRDYRCLLLSDCTAEPIGSDSSPSNHEADVADRWAVRPVDARRNLLLPDALLDGMDRLPGDQDRARSAVSDSLTDAAEGFQARHPSAPDDDQHRI